jgi:hypothetical protein
VVALLARLHEERIDRIEIVVDVEGVDLQLRLAVVEVNVHAVSDGRGPENSLGGVARIEVVDLVGPHEVALQKTAVHVEVQILADATGNADAGAVEMGQLHRPRC